MAEETFDWKKHRDHMICVAKQLSEHGLPSASMIYLRCYFKKPDLPEIIYDSLNLSVATERAYEEVQKWMKRRFNVYNKHSSDIICIGGFRRESAIAQEELVGVAKYFELLSSDISGLDEQTILRYEDLCETVYIPYAQAVNAELSQKKKLIN